MALLFLIAGALGLLLVSAIDASTAQDAGRALPLAAGTTLPEAYLPVVLKPPPTPTPTATPTASPSPGWLGYVNQFRDAAGLPDLTENSSWSNGGVLHSQYMVKEDDITHYENSGSSWYTVEGDQAGRNGNIFVSSWMGTADESAIDFWMVAPFHAVAIIDPELQVTGFGSYRENIGLWKMGATLDVQRGRGGLPAGITFPITFPKDGGNTWLTRFNGGEWPDPLTSCPGYSAPTGPAIMIQLGSGGITPSVTASSFNNGATSLTHCVFDETNYSNPDSGTQNIGRIVLGNRDAVVILPRDPLSVGQNYTASITANGNTHTWSFTVVAPTLLNLQSFPPAGQQLAR
jgi:uncharacterized protein YkwD